MVEKCLFQLAIIVPSSKAQRAQVHPQMMGHFFSLLLLHLPHHHNCGDLSFHIPSLSLINPSQNTLNHALLMTQNIRPNGRQKKRGGKQKRMQEMQEMHLRTCTSRHETITTCCGRYLLIIPTQIRCAESRTSSQRKRSTMMQGKCGGISHL